MLDHLVALIVAVVFPADAYRWFGKFRRRLAAEGDPVAVSSMRMGAWKKTIVVQWALTAGALAVWLGAGRPLGALGLEAEWHWRLGVGVLVVAIVTALLSAQNRALEKSAEERRKVADQLFSMRDFLPRGDRERVVFTGVALTAGICEEILYRGFITQYLDAFLPYWAAGVVATLAFALAHLYQGRAGAMRAGFTGAVLALLTWGSGSLVPAILLHVLIDVFGGRAAEMAIREVDDPRLPPANVQMGS